MHIPIPALMNSLTHLSTQIQQTGAQALRIAQGATDAYAPIVGEELSRHLNILTSSTHSGLTTLYTQAQQQIAHIDCNSLSTDVQSWVQAAATHKQFASAAVGQECFKWEVKEMPVVIMRWIEEHPAQTLFLVVGTVVFFFPELITAPMLASLGLPSEGVVAGSLAASIQSLIGNVGEGSLFALLQSAGAAGIGSAVLQRAVAGGMAVGIAAVVAAERGCGEGCGV